NKLSRFGDLLHEAWLLKRQLATNISDAHIDRLYEIARDAGAIGGKLLGAGGGGYLLLFCPFERKHIIAAELEEAGAQPVDFAFEAEPRGTAGALREAENYWSDFNLILNGDTECPFAFQPFYEYHRTKCADLSIGLAPAADSTRFGRVVTGADGRVETFLEKN